MFAPAKTPPGVIDRLSREIKKASTDPKFVAALAPQGMQIIASSPDEMAQAMREDFKKWGDVIADDRHHDQSMSAADHGIMIAPPFTATDCPVM